MRVVALIGSPVGHSLSPAMQEAAFADAGLDWRYVAFEVPAGGAAEALRAMRGLGIAGLSVTTPHKEGVFDVVDEVAPSAAALRSVNTVVRDDGDRLVGHSTDGDGFVDALGAADIGVSGASVAVVGAGAAARSIVDALGRAGAADVAVVNRTASRAEAAAALAPSGRVGTWDDVPAAAIVVNATSVGFGGDELAVDPGLLRAGRVVADVVYHPLRTALLDAATDRGCRTVDGLAMLVHQGARQHELWTGHRPDPSVMRTAALAELTRRG